MNTIAETIINPDIELIGLLKTRLDKLLHFEILPAFKGEITQLRLLIRKYMSVDKQSKE